MTRGDLHDRRAGRRNTEPYGLSFCLRTSFEQRSVFLTTVRLMENDGS
jgi:hypothetical protein